MLLLQKDIIFQKTVTSDSVVVVTSISGNTIETISMLENAIKLNSKNYCFF